MIVLDLKADNFFLFRDFHINMSYPKKPVKELIPFENISNRPNFRYKKIIILMGANATGKTSLGLLLMSIFNFMVDKEYSKIVNRIEDTSRPASFSIEFIASKKELIRVECVIEPKSGETYNSNDISVKVSKVDIGLRDSYENCVNKLDNLQNEWISDYSKAFEDISGLSWLFEYSITTEGSSRLYQPHDTNRYTNILKQTLMSLDPRIIDVTKLQEDDDVYFIKYENKSVLLNKGETYSGVLSSGTKEGIGVATVLAGIKAGGYKFFYCDEKFSHIHTDSEKAFLSVLIECLESDNQLFYTTHNTDILDMNLPKHSFAFLRREPNHTITCLYGSDILKRNTDSIKNAVENDVFGSLPDVDSIYELKNL